MSVGSELRSLTEYRTTTASYARAPGSPTRTNDTDGTDAELASTANGAVVTVFPSRLSLTVKRKTTSG